MRRSRSSSLDSLGRRRRRKASPARRPRRSSSSSSRSRSRSSSHRHRSSRRSRSRSYGRKRSRRSRNRSHGRNRDRRRRNHSHSRSMSDSPVRRPRSPFRASPQRTIDRVKPNQPTLVINEPNAISQLSEEEQMKLLLGINGFDSTKGKEVDENTKSAAVGTARRESKREYRQYMNRRGGFNRLLDK
ncbi:hypothetical protein CCR75_007579 [Bremia lactucae]|uniref:U4/U6.U5 small nuclear ribonucleoprotein 27kDa protein domain-containing protein n=1 Tax=Bremia lactucae TaxID=4779 RepID=A0A976FJM2_BRELC|nr:hypothetical protein CCR75_007579 [Bremia lactucae]